jgi:polysaccharide biosynthesis/export protein
MGVAMKVICAGRRRNGVHAFVTTMAVLVLSAPLGFGVPSCLAAAAQEGKQTPDTQDYRIGPGDVLQLFVWKEPELTREVAVRPDGKVTIPLLGDVDATGRLPQQLATDVTKMLARFIEVPVVTIGVKSSNSARFYVLGQVGHPGEFPLAGRTTVLQGLALAGGFREYARTDGIVVVRQDRGVFVPKGRPSETFIPVNYKKLEDGKDLSQNIVLAPGDTILVP